MQVTFYCAVEITQVLDATPWVRCASGNVFGNRPTFFVTIMTGHQKDNIFVLIMLQGKVLGGYKGPVLAQNMALIDQNDPFWGQKCIIILFAL